MDAIPVLSQAKSLFHVASGNRKKARQTQKNFSRQCPVVSQIRSVVETAKGDKGAALETQAECGRFLLGVVDRTPVLGHVKGVAHYVSGDKESGKLVVKSASDTTLVIGSLLLGGPGEAFLMGFRRYRKNKEPKKEDEEKLCVKAGQVEDTSQDYSELVSRKVDNQVELKLVSKKVDSQVEGKIVSKKVDNQVERKLVSKTVDSQVERNIVSKKVENQVDSRDGTKYRDWYEPLSTIFVLSLLGIGIFNLGRNFRR